MIKLHRRKPDSFAYWETWEDKGEHSIHWGEVGDRGQSETIRDSFFRSAAKAIASRVAGKRQEGFEEIEELHPLIIEYAVDGMGSSADLDQRHRLESRLNETLGWTGLGHCDGGSMGRGTMEVCCLIVDFDLAKKVVAADLAGTEFAHFTRIYEEE